MSGASERTAYMRFPDGVVHERNGSCAAIGCRPVAVVDPSVAAGVTDIRDLDRLLFSHGYRAGDPLFGGRLRALENAIREYAQPEPTKPGEPERIGAVVEHDGRKWVCLGFHRWIEVTVPGDLCEARRKLWVDFPATVKVVER